MENPNNYPSWAVVCNQSETLMGVFYASCAYDAAMAAARNEMPNQRYEMTEVSSLDLSNAAGYRVYCVSSDWAPESRDAAIDELLEAGSDAEFEMELEDPFEDRDDDEEYDLSDVVANRNWRKNMK